jgi:hypothetical protein
MELFSGPPWDPDTRKAMPSTSTSPGKVITTTPRTGAGNAALQAVGAGFGVRKLASDAPHWSTDGH